MEQRSARHGNALVAAGLAVIAVTYGLARYGYGLYLPEFRAAFGLSSGTAGVIAAGSYAGYCGAAVLAGRLVGSGRARAALWCAGAVAALGCLLVAAAWSGPVLAAGALLAGSGAGAATPATVAAVARTVPATGVPRAQGVVNSGTGAGVVAGGLLVLSVPGAWRWAWVGFAAAALAATAWADRSARWGGGDGPVPGVGPEEEEARVRLARPLVAAVLAGAGCAGVWTFGRDLLADDGGLPDRLTGLLWCVLGAAGLLGGISGVLVVRVGVRAAWIATVAAAAAGTGVLGVSAGSPVRAALSLALFGAAFVALSGVLLAWGAARAPGTAASAAASLFIGLTVGQAVGAVLLGRVADATSAPVAFTAAAGVLLLAAGAAERRPRIRRPAGLPGPLGQRTGARRPMV
ncbi:Predicted arabinose efflux permease, MFS family [Blastococcus aggregatus]|uniref:Predicted arabinose efflux permease, MFS family n=1 Tax=Blastococcus aggregatus TaxID=38502 RepID=A0A285V751_9ACTN|nr:MFS transporter [Blastococcus aggregatus]SOC49843.1 Predicted arabinose efflux permease, MFS family [Blastococcus aggregatus]